MTTSPIEKKKKGFSLTSGLGFELLRMLVAIFAALAITFIVLLFVDENAVNDFILLLYSPIKNISNFTIVLDKMVPLAFAGLATLLFFRTGVFNLGVEGIWYISGVLCTWYVTSNFLTGSNIVDPAVAIIISGLLGGIVSLFPGWLNAKYNANELVISLMMNSIFFGIGFFIVRSYLAEAGLSGTSSARFAASSVLGKLIPGTSIHAGIILMVLTTIFVYVLLFKTKLGYSINITGINPNFSRYAGMSAFALFMAVHFIAGFIGGAGSAIQLLSQFKRFTWKELPGYGFSGALMAMLGKNHPLGVLVAAFGISYLRTGAQLMSNASATIDVKLVSIAEVIICLLISSEYFLRKWKEKQLAKEGNKHE